MEDLFKLLEELNSLKDDDPELEEKAQRILSGIAELGGDIWKTRIRDIFEIASEYYVSQVDIHRKDPVTDILLTERTWSIEKK